MKMQNTNLKSGLPLGLSLRLLQTVVFHWALGYSRVSVDTVTWGPTADEGWVVADWGARGRGTVVKRGDSQESVP